MPNYALIDLGSNSIRLVVYALKPNTKPPYTKKDFKTLVNVKKIAGLSSYVEDGIFIDAGVRKAIEVLREHLNLASNFRCKDVRIFATAVIRNCKNSREARKQISRGAGLDVEILSARDEAHLGFVGATCDKALERGTLIDIGGGSTELTAIRNGADSHWASIPQGSVSSYSQHVYEILPTKDEIHSIEVAFTAELDKACELDPWRTDELYGIGGAARALCKFYGTAFTNGAKPASLEVSQVEEILSLLADDPHAFAHFAVKAAPDRLHTLIPGSVITMTLMRKLGARRIETRKFGVREGYLIERILPA